MAVSEITQKASTSTSAAASAAKQKKNTKSAVGAPSQRTQSSRKGKKAWRKNIDIDEVEGGLEELRVEERVTGSTLHQKKDDELFQIDVKGDDQIRKYLRPRFNSSQLTSARILAQRSAVPAISSRPTSSPSLKRKKVTHEEKERLLRIGKKMRRGPFNAVMDPTELGAGSALLELSEAAKKSGEYDVWEGDNEEVDDDDVVPKKAAPKKPEVPHPKKHIATPAVPSPHEGTSYNPPVAAHTSLIRAAAEAEEKRAREEEELKQTKKKMELARIVAQDEAMEIGTAPGMTVQEVVDDQAEPQQSIEVPAKKIPERKTKAERRKAEKLRAEKRLLAERAAQKRLLASVPSAKSLRKQTLKTVREREALLRARHAQQEQEKLTKGLAGQRLGKHFVPEGEIDVQLGEDLSESLRAMKPEGNLFKDRFLSMQQRALIEPRVPVLPKRKAKLKEYEKHSWKKFDREHNVII